MSPRRLLAVLAVLSALLVPAAVAWACNPSPSVKTDKLSYKEGETMTVSGRYFSTKETSTKQKNAVTLTTDPAGASAGPVTVRRTGTFRTKMATPNRPGSYTLLATSSNGSPAARTTFEVASPATAQPTPAKSISREFNVPSVEKAPPAGAGEKAPAGVTVVVPKGTTPGSPDGSGEPNRAAPQSARGGSAQQPARVFYQSAPASARTAGGGSVAGGTGGGFDGGGGSGSGSGGGNGGGGGTASGSEDGVIRDLAGRTVFVDSLAPADRRAGRAGDAGRTTTAAQQPAGRGGPSERAATGDLWGGFRSGKAPSLVEGDGSADDEGGPGASIGLGLLGLGLVGLLSALAVAEVRRRRALAG